MKKTKEKTEIVKEAEWMPGWGQETAPLQLKVLNTICSMTPGNYYVDVGCFFGGFTKVMAKRAKELRGKVFSIDTFKGAMEAHIDICKKYNIKEMFIRNMTERNLMDVIVLMEKSSLEACKEFGDESVDLVFIDADHRYSAVKEDIKCWYKKLKPGGVLCGHDYDGDQFDDAYLEIDSHKNRHHGVIKAFNLFLASKGIKELPHPKAGVCFTLWWYIK